MVIINLKKKYHLYYIMDDFEILVFYKCRRCRLKKEKYEYEINVQNRNWIFKTCKVCRSKYKSIPTKFNTPIIKNYC